MRGQRLDELDRQFADDFDDDFANDFDDDFDDEFAADDAGETVANVAVGSELAVRPPMVLTQRAPVLFAPPTRADIADQRARRLPYFATGATGAVGTAAWCAAELAAMAGQPALAGGVMVGTWVASGVGVGAMRWWFRNRILDGWHSTWWTSALASAVGANLVAGTGPAALAAVAVGGAAIAAVSGWMAAHDVADPRPALPPPPPAPPLPPPPPPLPKPPPGPPPLPMDPASVLQRKWDDRVASGEKGPLKGADLIPEDVLPTAAVWIIDTDGDFTFDEIAATRTKIAARLHVLARNVTIERDGEEEGRARLTVVFHDVLAENPTYPGPRYEAGAIPVALAADGTGWLYHYADDPDKGCRSGLVVGEPGSGKTATLEAIVAGKLKGGVWRVHYADGDPGGGSSPTLNELAHMARSGPTGALQVLESLEAVIELRSRLKPTLTRDPATGLLVTITDRKRQKAVREMHATHQFPGYVGVFDEFHRNAEDEKLLKDHRFIKRVERVARIGRKYGVVLLVGTQSLLSADFGLSTNLRAYLAARNAWILRSQNQSEANALNGVAGAAASLPEKPGYCYAAGSKRMMLARVAWEEGLERHAATFPDCPGDRLSELAAALYRPADINLDDVLEERLQSVEDIKAALVAGRNPFIDTPDDEKDGGKPAAKPQNPAAGQRDQQPQRWSTPRGAGIPAPLTGATVTQLRPPPASPAPAAASRQDAAPLHRKSQLILDVLRRDPTRTWPSAELRDPTGLSASDVSTFGGPLLERGLAHRPTGKTGYWQFGPASSAQPGTPA